MPGTTRKSRATRAAAPAAEAPVETRQFPSLSGEPGVEIAERSQDVEARSASEHLKVFVVQRNVDGADFDDAMHQRNIDSMRQSAILQGLRPTGDGRFVKQEDGTDDESVRLTYALPVTPAVVDDVTSTHYVTEADQHGFDQAEAEAEAKDQPVAPDPLADVSREGTAGNTESGDNEPPAGQSTTEGTGDQA